MLFLILLIIIPMISSDNRIITTLLHSPHRVQPTIVKGHPAKLDELPFMVSIKERWKHFGSKDYIWTNLCGGSILQETKILTAAHCFEPKYFYYVHHGENLRAVAGSLHNRLIEYKKQKSGSIEDPQWRKINKTVIHQEYHFPYHDIALVFTTREFIFNNKVGYVLPATRSTEETNACIAAGFGKTGYREKDKHSQQLLLAKIEVLPESVCTFIWGVNMSEFICSHSTPADVSIGDSGGPLVCETHKGVRAFAAGPNLKGTEVLVGVVSGKNFDKTTLFTRVAAYSDWIDQGIVTNCALQTRACLFLIILMFLM